MSPLLASLLHSLWIGLLIWAATRFALRQISHTTTSVRHATALGAVLLLFIGWGCAWMTQTARQPAPFEAPRLSTAPDVIDAEVATTPATTPAPPPAPIHVTARVESLRRAATLQTWLEAFWLAGVLLGLARIAVGLRANGARWLARQTTAPLPPVWAEAWSGQIKTLGERFKARLVAIETAGAPFVVGLVEPVIVVPLAACAGVMPELARAALAHELAHIARHDWLVEIVLRVVEAVLFFNPFVWLLAAQVRTEREACCDAWACESIAMPRIKFAEALLDWGRRFTPAPACGLELKGGRGGLRGRVERLLGGTPASSPRTTQNWRGMAAVLVLVAAGLAGYATILRLGASALRDEERITLLDEASAPYRGVDPWVQAPQIQQQTERIVSGIVVDESGAPVPSAHVHLVSTNIREEGARTDANGRFTARRPLTGPLRITVRAQGYAVRQTHVEADEAELREPIKLTTGRDVAVLVLDENDQPLGDARINWNLDNRGQNKLDQAHSDASGRAIIRHLPDDIPVHLQIEAPGHATLAHRTLRVADYSADSPLVIRLRPAGVTTLRVVFEDDGTPVPDVRVRVGSSTPERSPIGNPYPSWNYSGLGSGPDGVVKLEHLRPEVAYRLSVGSPRTESASVELEPGHVGEKIVRLARLRPLRVSFKNFPDPFRGEVVRFSSMRTDPASGHVYSQSHHVKLDAHGAGSTLINYTGTGQFTLRFQDRRLQSLNVDTPSALNLGDELVIDYANIPPEARTLRRVEIRFMHGNTRLFPAGRFYISRQEPNVWQSDGFSLQPDQPLFAEWTIGTRLKPTSGWAMIGATVDLEKWGEYHEILIDDQTTEIVVPVKPAGMIRAQVVNAEGALVRDAAVRGFTTHRNVENRRHLSFPGNRHYGEWQASGPVDFGLGGHRIWGADGMVFALSQPLRVSARNPVADVVVRLPKTQRYTFLFTDERGQPVAGVACRLRVRFGPEDLPDPPMSFIDLTSDQSGRVTFDAGEDLADWKGLTLMVEASGLGRARTRVMVPAQTMNAPTPIRLPPAVAFTGRVVNRATGLGIPGVTVRRRSVSATAFAQEPGVLTNADGRFVFTDFAAGERFQLWPEWSTHLGLKRTPSPVSEYTTTDTGVVIHLEPE